MLLLLAIIGGVIGWMTNVIAIKLMFRPLNPVKIPLTPFVLQGLIPKRKAEIAKSIGEVVDQELISMEQIVDQLIEDTDKQQILAMIKEKVLAIAEEKMPSLLSMFKGAILSSIGDIIDQNGEQMIVELTEKLSHKAIEKVNISQLVEERIMAYEFDKIEEIIIKIAKNELKHIEFLGGLIGFVIGLLQGGIVLLLIQ